MKTILIVDDELDLIWSLSRGLRKSFPTARIFTASTYVDALQILQEESVDIMISDYRLADGDGVTLISEAMKLHEGLNTVLMTAYGSDDLDALLLKIPNTAYIEKPFEISSLRNLISENLYITSYPTTSESVFAQ